MEVGAARHETIGRHDRALTALEIGALMKERAQVEIQLTAVVSD